MMLVPVLTLQQPQQHLCMRKHILTKSDTYTFPPGKFNPEIQN